MPDVNTWVSIVSCAVGISGLVVAGVFRHRDKQLRRRTLWVSKRVMSVANDARAHGLTLHYQGRYIESGHIHTITIRNTGAGSILKKDFEDGEIAICFGGEIVAVLEPAEHDDQLVLSGTEMAPARSCKVSWLPVTLHEQSELLLRVLVDGDSSVRVSVQFPNCTVTDEAAAREAHRKQAKSDERKGLVIPLLCAVVTAVALRWAGNREWLSWSVAVGGCTAMFVSLFLGFRREVWRARRYGFMSRSS